LDLQKRKKMKKLSLFTDGAARGNPGPAGAGFVLFNDANEVVFEGAKYLGEATNNQAEYTALDEGLKKALELECAEINIYMDSELIVKQIKGEYRVKNQGLKPMFKDVTLKLSKFENYTISHVRRENNKQADKLANKAIDDVL